MSSAPAPTSFGYSHVRAAWNCRRTMIRVMPISTCGLKPPWYARLVGTPIRRPLIGRAHGHRISCVSVCAYMHQTQLTAQDSWVWDNSFFESFSFSKSPWDRACSTILDDQSSSVARNVFVRFASLDCRNAQRSSRESPKRNHQTQAGLRNSNRLGHTSFFVRPNFQGLFQPAGFLANLANSQPKVSLWARHSWT